MKLQMPRPLDQVLRRLLVFRLFLPLGLALIGIFCMAGWLVWQSLRQQSESQSVSLSLRIEDRLRSARQVLEAAAAVAQDHDRPGAAENLSLVRRSYPEFLALYILDTQGKVSIADPAGAGLPAEALTSHSLGSGAALSEPYISPGSSQAVVRIAENIPGGGQIAGDLTLQTVQEILDHEPQSTSLVDQIRIYSPNGLTVAQTITEGGRIQTAAGPLPQAGFSIDRGVPGFLKLTNLHAIEGTGWVMVSESWIFHNLRGMILGGILTMLLMIGLAVELGLNYGRKLRRSVVMPLAALNERASKMAKGDFTNTVSFATVATSFYEVAELAGTFQQAQQAILQRQSKLQSNEKRFRAMAELLPDMAFEMDVQREITFANRTVSRLIGYTAKDFEEGISFDRLIPEGDLEMVQKALAQIASGKQNQLLICRFLRRTRQTFPVELSMSAMQDPAGELSGFRCVARDITERLKSEQNLHRSFQLFTGGPVVVFRVEAGMMGKTEYVSPNISQFGYTGEDFLSKPGFFEQIIHPNDQARVQSEAAAQLQAGANHYDQEYRIVCKGGEVRWMYVFTSVTRASASQPAYLDWYMLDITQRKNSEERLQTQIQRLGALQTVGAFIENNADLRFTLQTIVVQLMEMLKVDAVAILRYDPTSDELVYAIHDGFFLEDTLQYRFQMGESYPGMVALNRKAMPITTEPGILAADFKLREMAREQFSTYYGLPLITQGELQGVLEIFHRAPLDQESDWQDFLDTLAAQAAIAIHNSGMLNTLHRTNEQLIQALVHALEERDGETWEHSDRLRRWTEKFGARVGLTAEAIENAGIGAWLHDIGKIGVPDEILLFKGKLNVKDRIKMMEHPKIARRILTPVEYLRPALVIPYCHHERYDGSGYPEGLSGEQIPLAARIFTIVDVWDALLSKRPYRKTDFTLQEAVVYMRSEKGKYFDPHLVDVFLEMVNEENGDLEETLDTQPGSG